MASLNLANGWSSTLSWAISDVETAVEVASTSGIPDRPFRAVILADGANADEIVDVTDLTGSTLTITRAVEANAVGSSSGSGHGVNAIIAHVLTAGTLLGGWTNSAEATLVDTDAGAAFGANLAAYTVFDITLTENCTITFSNPPSSGVARGWTFIIRQGGSGSYTVTWPSEVKWAAADGTPTTTSPTLYTAVTAVNVATLITDDGGTTYGASLSGGVSSATAGTSFPGSPATNQRYFRTDLGLECYYDGTRWLTINLFREEVVSLGGTAPITATGSYFGGAMFNGAYSIYVENAYLLSFSSGLTGSAYWTYDLGWLSTTNSLTSIASANSSADTNSNWYNKVTAVNAVIGTTLRAWRLTVTKTSTPNATYFGATITYRLVIT